jgi:putative SOS response-associated peptidase YedK
MCGRFVGFRSLEQLKHFFPIDRAACDPVENYNVAPSQEILAIVNRERENWLDCFHWGLVPFWSKDTAIGNRMINARVETVATKPSFRNAFKKRRCLIPADGFFEWKGKKGQKQPMFITLPDGSPFAFAGLWETWHLKDPEADLYQSCTIITCEASGPMKEIHHRMPVILQPYAYTTWLDPKNENTDTLETLLRNRYITDLKSFPVSTQVNRVQHNTPQNIEPVQMPLEF